MYFLLTGEGPTDIGICGGDAMICEGENHEEGPMTHFVSQLAEERLGYSFVDVGYYGCVSKSELVARAEVFKREKKSPRLTGKKKPKETCYFYRNARTLAFLAKEKEANIGKKVIAVLFRDTDSKASAGRGTYEYKRNSMIRGFAEEGYGRGVPMIPKPISEAWLTCAAKADRYQHCAALENRSSSPNAAHPLKDELSELLNGATSREQLCEMVKDGTIDVKQIEMPSMTDFKESLTAALRT